MTNLNVQPVGNYPTYRAATPAAVEPTGTGYAPAATAQGDTLTLGRVAAWGGGAFAAARVVGSTIGTPQGLAAGAVLVGGAVGGDKVYKAVTGQEKADIGRWAAWGGGAFAAFKWVRPLFQNPTGLGLAALLGAGAFVGNKVYNWITQKG
jgi:hypothetical protein